MENLRQDLTVMIQQELKTGKVQVGIDEGAFRKAKSKIDSLFKDIGRFISADSDRKAHVWKLYVQYCGWLFGTIYYSGI